MKRYISIILPLVATKLGIQWLGNRHYGFHRDELLHLSVGEHLAWGYMEFPPFIAGVGRLALELFDYSLLGVRLFPTLAGVGVLLLCVAMARELGGKGGGVLLAGICVLAFLPFYRNHTLFQPVAFDQFFWTLGFYFTVRFLRSEDPRQLIGAGVALGLGLLTKYTIFVWAFGLFVGLGFYRRGWLFRSRWFYLSAFIALLIFLPNAVWQIQNDFPLLRHLASLREKQLDAIDPLAFGREQLNFPFTLAVSLIGIYAFWFDSELKRYRPIGVAAGVIFATMWLLGAKAYYVFALYPVLFAGGAAQIARWLKHRTARVVGVAAIVLLPSIYFIPEVTPVLPIEQFVAYAGLEEKNGRVELTGDYADMFGWEEQVALVDSVYRSLSPRERADCVLWAENYGEAGALKILGRTYGLPDPISRHGSFWTWGYGNPEAAVWISLGNERPSVEQVFAEVELVKIITHKYAIEEENRIPLYLCRRPKVDIAQWWQSYEPHIFD